MNPWQPALGRCVAAYPHAACPFHLGQDTALEPGPASQLPAIKDEAGALVPRSTLLALERSLAAKCLLYAVLADKRVAPSESIHGWGAGTVLG